jgi:hypothetical protein
VSRRTRHTTHAELTRAREALAKARDRREDPWRIQELVTRYDALLDAALAEADGSGPAEPRLEEHPAPRGPVPPIPLSWLDQSVPARGRRGEPS